jgi:hypothetical protein
MIVGMRHGRPRNFIQAQQQHLYDRAEIAVRRIFS